MTRTGAYGRQSKGNDKSIDQQLEEQIADILRLGWTVTKKYSDGVSASRFGKKVRDEWNLLLADIELGRIDAVSLWESSRGDRNNTSWNQFLDMCREHKVLIRVTTHGRTYDMNNARDWRSMAEDGVDSAYESEKTRERILRDVRANAAKGRPGGRLLYGYTRTYDERGNFVAQRPHLSQSLIVKEAARRVAKLEPLEAIAKDFNERGVPTPSAAAKVTSPSGDDLSQNVTVSFDTVAESKWSGTQVKRLCTNQAYLGLRVHKDSVFPAVWPALIDAATFEACAAILGNPRRKTWQDGSTKHLLSGIALCDACGSTMRIQNNRGKLYYQSECFHVSIPAAALDDYVAENMRDRTFELAATETEDSISADVHKNTLEQLKQERAEFLKEAMALKMKASDLVPLLNARDAEIQELEAAQRSSHVPAIVYEYVANPSLWDEYSIHGQRELLRDLVEIRVCKVGKVGRYGAPPMADRVSITTRATMGGSVSKAGQPEVFLVTGFSAA